jgi:urease accessory protein
MNRLNRYAVLASALMLPLMAQAHPGHEIHATLMQGLLHPLTGWDHLFVLLSLGALAAGRGARVAAICGVLLAAALSGGAMVGLAWPTVPFVEPAIFVTVLACALLLVLRRPITRGSLSALCMLFALVHGVAHGQEAPGGDLVAYFAGFTFSGAAIYAAGVVLTQRLLWRMSPAAARSD